MIKDSKPVAAPTPIDASDLELVRLTLPAEADNRLGEEPTGRDFHLRVRRSQAPEAYIP